MKKLMSLLFIVLSFSLFISCSEKEEQKDPQKASVDIALEKLEISQRLDNLAAASESGNFGMIEDIWLPSEDALLIGTEGTEKLEGWEDISAAIKKQIGTFEKTFISITEQLIWLNDDASIAWFFEELNYNFIYEEKAMTFEGIRFTGVMKKIDGKWRLVQQHMSIPAMLEMVESY